MVESDWSGFWFRYWCHLKVVYLKTHLGREKRLKELEVVLIIECSKTLVEVVMDTLWSNNVLGESKLDHDVNK